MAMPDKFKLHILNKTGATIDFSVTGTNNFVVTGKGWKRDSNGAIVFGSEQTLFADNDTSLAANNDMAGSEIDNSTNKYEGYFATARLITSAAVSGHVAVYLEWSTDGGTTYPSGAEDFDENVIESDLILVGRVPCTATDDDRSVNFEL